MTKSNIREIVIQLKHIKEERKLTIQQIYDMLERSNKHLALNTLVKVFSEDSENAGFQEETIRSLADVLLDVYVDSETDDSEIKGLKSTIKLQNVIISQLEEHLKTANTALGNEQISALRRIDFLRDRIEKQDLRIEQKDRLITIMLMILIEKLDPNSEYGDLVKVYFKNTIADLSEYLKGLNPKE